MKMEPHSAIECSLTLILLDVINQYRPSISIPSLFVLLHCNPSANYPTEYQYQYLGGHESNHFTSIPSIIISNTSTHSHRYCIEREQFAVGWICVISIAWSYTSSNQSCWLLLISVERVFLESIINSLKSIHSSQYSNRTRVSLIPVIQN